MEKIYMQDSGKNNKKKIRNISISTSVLVAIVAVAALIGIGFGQISFAIPEEGITLGNEFTSKTPEVKNIIYGNTSGFGVNQLYTSDDKLVYCIERDIPYVGELKYTKSERILDSGLLYLMANLYPNVSFKDGENDLPVGAQVWLSQSAIWVYAKTNNYENNDEMTTEVVKNILLETELYDSEYQTVAKLSEEDLETGYTSLMDKYGILKLINEANALGTSPSNSLLATKSSEKITMTSDGKYYQTDFIKVLGTVLSDKIGSFNGFELKIRNAPEGVVVIDKEGKEINDITNMSPEVEFAFKIPVNKITEANKNMEVSVLGSFNSFAADIYTATNSQTVTSVKKINNNLSVPLEFQLNYTPTVPNTELNDSGTLYIIGLILLLSGLGIFYTSAKKN